MSTLLSFYLIFYFILAKIRLDWAVMLFIAALPTYLIRFSILGIPFTLLEAMILISFAVWVVANYRQLIANLRQAVAVPFGRLRRGGEKVRYPFDLEIILLLIISFVAIAVAGFSDSAFGIWKAYFFEPALVFILVLNVFGKFSVGTGHALFLRKILWPLAISAFAVSVFAIYQKFTGHFIFNELWAAEKTRRVTSFFGYPNAVGLYLGPLVMVMTGWIAGQIRNFKDKNSKSQAPNNKQITNYKLQITKIVFITVIILASLLSIYFAKSEGALVAVAVGMLLFGVLAGKKIRWATVLLIFIAGLGIIMSQPTRDYAVKKITLHDLSGEIRKQQWRETWQMMAISPARFIFGTGLANYQNAIEPYHQEGIFFNKDNDPDFCRKIVIFDDKYRAEHWQPVEVYLYPHNILLNFWTELGLAGMLLFIWIIGKFFIIGLKLYRRVMGYKLLVIGLPCGMVAVAVHGIVDVPYFKNDLAVMFWLLVAMMSLVNLENPPQINKSFHKSTNS